MWPSKYNFSEPKTVKIHKFTLDSQVVEEQKNSSKYTAVPDGEISENDKSKSEIDTSEIRPISCVNLVREWKKSKTAEGKRRGSSGSSRRKRYDTDRV